MLPDGIFESVLGHQLLNAHFRNEDANSVRVNVYIESVSDPRFVITSRTYNVDLPAGAFHLFSWDVNVSMVPPGVYQVSFIAENAEGQIRIIKKVFVMRVRFDPSTKTFSAQAPEGRIELRLKDLIKPENNRCCGDRRLSQCTTEENSNANFLDQAGQLFRQCQSDFELCPSGYFFHDLEVVATPTPVYAGQYSDLPFEDPWWKPILAVIAALLKLASAIVAATTGGSGQVIVTSETAPINIPNCCGINFEGSGGSRVATGLDYAAKVAAYIAGASDIRDPFRRGQDHTKPVEGELTVEERLNMSFSYPELIALGKPFTVDVKWTYTRVTTGASYNYSVEEANINTHVLSRYKIQAPNVIRAYREEPFIVQGKFFDQDDTLLRGNQLFIQCILTGPQGQYRSFVMQDNGIYPDERPGDGIYTGRTFFASQDHGFWMIYVIAQDVNNAPSDMSPEQAANDLRGLLWTHQLTITFTGGTCPLVPDGEVHVISSLGS